MENRSNGVGPAVMGTEPAWGVWGDNRPAGWAAFGREEEDGGRRQGLPGGRASLQEGTGPSQGHATLRR